MQSLNIQVPDPSGKPEVELEDPAVVGLHAIHHALLRAVRFPPAIDLVPGVQDGPHAVAAVSEAKRDRLALPARPDRDGPVDDPWHRNPPKVF